MIDLEISTEASGWETSIPDLEERVGKAVDAAVAAVPSPPGEATLSVLLTDDAAIRELNAAWRHQDKPTNVLSFPAPATMPGPGPRHLGDIALAFETMVREAETEGKTLQDHLSHLVIHGVLHLLGFDHEVEAEAEIMESLEVAALRSLGIADPYREKAA
ncbi:rRNA maturation RNase YbeY [Microvirga massiliensis]|uniref:rRNA maturation RNase YbeY n=1 Tax=Microvirga massiliensis TaxID=1033741 RepID=UPI00062B4D78|nr:rRNA maturation RNase YbeY [Microvirga massiliensis]